MTASSVAIMDGGRIKNDGNFGTAMVSIAGISKEGPAMM
jgi:hypothetical protein